ncbi:hypothetical protein [Gordonia alkaliphila]|uniref:Uncharacterized protein n=1 Tax=Gordonia alkaliphila TaxID=1053547 RepID=A0ABP8ZGE7_9ACTN
MTEQAEASILELRDVTRELDAAHGDLAEARAVIDRVRAQVDRWDQWNRVLIAGGAGGIASVPLSDVVHDIRRALDGDVSGE